MRQITSKFCTIGKTARTDAKTSRRATITKLTVYDALDEYGDPAKLCGVTADSTSLASGTGKPTLYLTADGAIELVKGLLQFLSAQSPITMAADDEFRTILAVVGGAAAVEDAAAQAVVNMVRNSH